MSWRYKDRLFIDNDINTCILGIKKADLDATVSISNKKDAKG